MINKTGMLTKKLEVKRELAAICNAVIDRESARGRLKLPKSMRNLRRWLKRELVKRARKSVLCNRRQLIKAALNLLLMSGLMVSGMQAAQAAVTFNRTSSVNSEAYINATPTVVDIDADGDPDVFSGDYQGAIFFSENTGTRESFAFTARTGIANPFNGIDVGDDSAPTFADIDNDGDFDAFVGENLGAVKYFENTGSAANAAFTERSGVDNPLNSVAANGSAKPVFSDIDSDGDLDAFVGELSGQFKYYENTGTVDSPSFTERTGALNPLDGIDVGSDSAASFVDIDKDGDFDAMIGADGSTRYFENTGSASTSVFTERTGHLNPLDDISHTESVPTFADMDFDGDKDLILGWSYGRDIEYYENIPRIINNGTFTETFGAANPLDGFDVGRTSQPTFADIDSDGDMDAFVGNYDGDARYFENTGSAASPAFTERTGVSNPLDAVAVTWGDSEGAFSSPTFADIDDDGDLDFFVGGYYGLVEYFENTDLSGGKTSPVFVKRTGLDNPLDAVSVTSYSNPVFADIDNDGDLDLFISYPIKYYENTGSAASPVFVEQVGGSNPLDGFNVGYNPAIVDFDGDGDLDLFAGEYNGKVRYFENTGSVASPVFVEGSGSANPLNGFDVGIQWGVAAPAFTDIDNDGDLDAFVGEWDGTLNFFLNNPHVGGNSAPTFNSAPTISGSPQIGEILGLINIATTDIDGDNVTLSYQWKADNVDISGATSAIYALTANESAKLITCNITADDGNSGITATTTAGMTVINNAPTFNSAPVISGTATVGETLSLIDTVTTDTDGDTVTLSYQWQANGVDIAGATSSTFTLTADELGMSVTATITADDGNGGITPVTTSALTVIESANTDVDGGGSLGWMLLLAGIIAPFRYLRKR